LQRHPFSHSRQALRGSRIERCRLSQSTDPIHRAIRAGWAERIQAQGLEVVGSTPEALAQLMVKHAAKYKRIIQEIGLKPQ